MAIFAAPKLIGTMKRIETNGHLSYKKIADIVIDKQRLYSETIGEDKDGNIILHKSSTINMSSGYGESSEYFILSPEEYSRYIPKRKKK